MKKTILVLSLSVIISCNSKTSYQKKAADTTKTAALYINNRGELSGGFVFRITKDTSYFDTLNSSTAKLINKRDTTYYVPIVYGLIDSLNKPILDSSGKQKTTIQYMPETNKKHILHDYNISN